MRSIQRSIESLQSEISEMKKSNSQRTLASVTSHSQLDASANQNLVNHYDNEDYSDQYRSQSQLEQVFSVSLITKGSSYKSKKLEHSKYYSKRCLKTSEFDRSVHRYSSTDLNNFSTDSILSS